MKLTQLVLAALGTTALFTMTSAKAQVFADWTFQSDTVAVNNTPIADSGIDGQTGNSSAQADAIGMTNTYTSTLGPSVNTDDVVLGKTSDTGTNTVADTTDTWRVRAAAASPNNGNGWNSAAPIATQGAQFFSSTVGATGSAITVNFDWYATTQGEANLVLEYTTNSGANWTPISLSAAGSDTGLQLLTNSTSANTIQGVTYASDNLLTNSKGGQDWFTDLTATITNSAALNDAGFGIELVNASTGADDVSTQGAALNNNSGNWRFDNIEIQATPEPSSWMLGLGAAAIFAVITLRRKRA